MNPGLKQEPVNFSGLSCLSNSVSQTTNTNPIGGFGMKMNRGFAPFLWVLVAILLVSTAFAQETTAGLQGTVRDPQGLAVSKAAVEVSGPALIGTKKLETDSSGYYRFANLPVGEYTITISAPNFKPSKLTGVKLSAGSLPTIDPKLEVGAIEQTVEVSG